MQTYTARELGMDSEAVPSDAQAKIYEFPAAGDTQSDENMDHFIVRDGKCFAGTHLIIDLWGASRLDEIEHIRATLRDAVEKAGATLLHIHLHHFTPNGGVSGVAVLAESHISIHSWPERDYAALDVFMCGDSEPHKAIEVFREAFRPERIDVGEHLRGEAGAE
ncbi:adenosylmethionine decarboxylase [Ferruginivarius sediminum]|nr:adenosylmethionine decarboxylase [Ferruginivarius sediminum]